MRDVKTDIGWVDANNPGTPDNLVPKARLNGRKAARDGRPSDDGLDVRLTDRVQWYLGWYDVGLEKWYRKGRIGR